MAPRVTAKISDAQGSPFAVAIEASGHHLFGDEPLSQGGADRGPSPYDLLTAALGACTAMTVRWFAAQKTWPLDHVEVEVRHGRKMEAGADAIIDEFQKTVTLIGPGLTDEQRAKLLDVADKCPVHKTLTGTIRIKTIAGA